MKIVGVKDVTSDTWESEVLKTDGLVMVVFWAGWCEPCIELNRTIEKMAAECSGKVKIVRLNIDESGDIASKYRVSIVPTTMFFVDGQKCREIITNVSRELLEETVNSI